MGKDSRRNTTFDIAMSWNCYRIPFGTVFHSSMVSPAFFQGAAALMLRICEVCDRQDFPPRDVPWRSVLRDSGGRIITPDGCARMLPQRTLRFSATIVSRKNCTVRGYFNVFDKQLIFRSGLEAENFLFEMIQCAEDRELMTDEARIPYARIPGSK